MSVYDIGTWSLYKVGTYSIAFRDGAFNSGKEALNYALHNENLMKHLEYTEAGA